MIFLKITWFDVFLGGSLQAILLCILGELAGEGAVAVAVGINDRLQGTGDTRRVTYDT